ncbi:MAG: VacJ family lipoprotein [Gammaproteobacteria bacterium]
MNGARLTTRPALLAMVFAITVTGCASRNAATAGEAYDPLEPVNRVMYRVNDLGDKYLLRPVAVGYTYALPQPIRTGVSNVFSNLLYPVTIANDFLQGKFRQVGHDGARFLLNSTVGLAGLFDPATRLGLEEHDEDLDQTLAVWGVGEGPYLVIPLFGPRTLRHLVGDAADAPLTPFYGALDSDSNVALGAWFLNQVDRRSRFLDTDNQVFEAYDPYTFVRDAYLQNRRYLALDGDVAEDNSYLDDPETYKPGLDEPDSGER